jgi:DNA-binding protein YbaB
MLLRPGDFDPHELERISKESEQALHRLNEIQRQLTEIRGTGTAAGGQVVVEADHSGRIASIRLDPRIMKLSSKDLADELLRAINSAQDDCTRQAQELIAGTGAPAAVDEAAFEELDRRLRDARDVFERQMERFGKS